MLDLILEGPDPHDFTPDGFYQPDEVPSYEWFMDGAPMANSDTFLITVTQEADYFAVVQNGLQGANCSYTTETVTIRVNTINDSLIFDPVNDTIFCDGDSASD